jgi:hypothetical protein
MRSRVQQLLSAVYGLLVVAAIGFGLLVATAKPANALDCANDGVWFLGSKPIYQACYDACYAIHGPGITAVWNSTTTCCKCLL